ncbi:MBL fold metallo-hydrolase [Paenisporosarcina antarctica]|uniref:MBL fold metallo-hydrolase n=1 Tax=Paenisporosarcina antarctica TaxID=417367 RepID=A0A4P6ZWC1_9BACL|nr:MBL fold metallo-hydrolase [Paenisporosarcina antarctica]QBP40910.1 MBL fold metallo-hydrolase [Paenisporosarcina antarctica]
MLNIRTFPLGPLQTNCYVISNKEKHCLIIDPGEQGETLLKEIRRLQLKPLAILLTHAHFDHIGAVDVVREFFKIPVYIHQAEKSWLADSTKNGSARFRELPLVECKPADVLIEGEGQLEIGPFSCYMFYTPGHSPGSITYWFEEDGFAIVGDTLFQGSIGRTDLPHGNDKELIQSIHNKLLTLPENTICYPGHGNPTTPQEEMNQNPFLNGF